MLLILAIFCLWPKPHKNPSLQAVRIRVWVHNILLTIINSLSSLSLGVGHFREELNPFSDMLPEDIEREKEGLIPSAPPSAKRIFSTGLIWEPNRKNTPEEQARLDEMYSKMANRDTYPDSYDARDDGM